MGGPHEADHDDVGEIESKHMPYAELHTRTLRASFCP